jgi:hypothetical protein
MGSEIVIVVNKNKQENIPRLKQYVFNSFYKFNQSIKTSNKKDTFVQTIPHMGSYLFSVLFFMKWLELFEPIASMDQQCYQHMEQLFDLCMNYYGNCLKEMGSATCNSITIQSLTKRSQNTSYQNKIEENKEGEGEKKGEGEGKGEREGEGKREGKREGNKEEESMNGGKKKKKKSKKKDKKKHLKKNEFSH